VNDRPKTMSERTARSRAGDKGRQWIRVKDGKLSGPDPTVELVGTSLSTALADAQAAETDAAAPSQPVEFDAVASGAQALDANGQQARADSGAAPAAPALPASSTAPTATAGTAPAGAATAGKRQGSSAKPTSASTNAKHAFAAGRSVARKLALQAIYRWLLNDAPWQDLVKEFGEAEDMPNADPKYFREVVEGVWASRQSLDEKLTELVDRPVEQLDPVEHSVLLIGLYELSAKPEVPYRVAINEAVGLAKRFGATDGHKFVNAVLDRAARTLRPGEN
jgi:N utilization substance protein B